MTRKSKSIGIAFSLALAAASPAAAQDRSADNAVTEAEDGFGFSVGRETLGIYGPGNARGFSPTAAGNVRIDGLYFDPAYSLSSLVTDSISIKVGLSAQGYPFAAPSGIVDQSLRRPEWRAGASVLINGDAFGSGGVEVTGSLPVTAKLALGYGVSGGHIEYPDGTSNWNHAQGLIALWRPAPGVELMPFWTLSNAYDDEAGPYYIPAGAFLPPQPRQRRFDGPEWANNRYGGTNHGLVASVAPAQNWVVRIGAFRSVSDTSEGYSNLLTDLQPDGSADRLIIADPRTVNRSLSGELRVTHSIAEGPRLHVFHASIRARDTRRQFDGSDEADLGPTRMGIPVTAPRPAFSFGPIGGDHVRQTSLGIAYDGRWKDAGEISFSVSRADYAKTTTLPGTTPIEARSRPWLYNGTAAVFVSSKLAFYAGYARGLEESGVAPPNAANRNQPLPAIRTEQKDAGLRLQVTSSIKLVAGVFDLRRPYFSFDAANRFTQVGTTRSRGAEVSVSGALTPRLNLVAGGVFLKPRVERDVTTVRTIGLRPVGLPTHLLNANINWRTPLLEGLSLDAAMIHRGRAAGTTDNVVQIPSRARFDLGGRYRFNLSGQSATLRLQMTNVLDRGGFSAAGPGIYAANPGRAITGYLAVDI